MSVSTIANVEPYTHLINHVLSDYHKDYHMSDSYGNYLLAPSVSYFQHTLFVPTY